MKALSLPAVLSRFLTYDRLRLTGILAFLCYLVHASVHLLDARYEHLLWSCHTGAICVSFGLFFHQSRLNSIGVLLLAAGFPLWLIAVATGGVFYPTTLLIHVVVLYLGFCGTKSLGISKMSWLWTTVLLAILLILCRALTSVDIERKHGVFPHPDIRTGWFAYYSPALHTQCRCIAVLGNRDIVASARIMR